MSDTQATTTRAELSMEAFSKLYEKLPFHRAVRSVTWCPGCGRPIGRDEPHRFAPDGILPWHTNCHQRLFLRLCREAHYKAHRDRRAALPGFVGAAGAACAVAIQPSNNPLVLVVLGLCALGAALWRWRSSRRWHRALMDRRTWLMEPWAIAAFEDQPNP